MKRQDMGSISFEFRRQIVHVVLGIFIILLSLINRNLTLWLLFFSAIVLVFLSLLQLKFKFRAIEYVLENFERKTCKKKFPFKGALFFLIGSLLVLKIFSLDIALASIAILTFSDSVSHVVGIFGRKRNPLDLSKNVEGATAGVIAGTVSAAFFVPIFFAFLASLVSMLAEALSFKLQEEEVDDNIIIPLASGTVIFLLQRFA